MNLTTNALPLALKTVLTVSALASLLWPKKVLYICYRSRQVAENLFYVRMFQILSAVALTGLLIDVISDLMGGGH
jgi:hypothetical protein